MTMHYWVKLMKYFRIILLVIGILRIVMIGLAYNIVILVLEALVLFAITLRRGLILIWLMRFGRFDLEMNIEANNWIKHINIERTLY
jgi:hypothetical protein